MNAGVSYIVITFNRREGLLKNLRAIYANDRSADVWVVDNASADGTADAVRAFFPRARLIVLDKNLGMPARNVALKRITAPFAVLLDDDSRPTGDAVARSVAHLREYPDVAAVVGRVELPTGEVEAPAMPAVLLGGASCVRVAALRDVGYFPDDFFRQAEEYDLSARLWNAGYRVERFEDVVFLHDKTPAPGRASATVLSLDLKHNLIVAARYLPTPHATAYREDFIQRYGTLLRAAGHGELLAETIDAADAVVTNPRLLRREPLSPAAFEAMFEHRAQSAAIARWASRHGVRHVAITDYSKNLYATFRACVEHGLGIVAIVDARPAFANASYRGVPILPHAALGRTLIDGVVVSNTNPAQMDRVAAAARGLSRAPVLTLWQGQALTSDEAMELAA